MKIKGNPFSSSSYGRGKRYKQNIAEVAAVMTAADRLGVDDIIVFQSSSAVYVSIEKVGGYGYAASQEIEEGECKEKKKVLLVEASKLRRKELRRWIDKIESWVD